ncbi:uncharacterized protein EI90DRAFT_3019370 [Cantharellus anzutake]|uniref:uncharacterized protein n=1 Tax=Cantharellus anzutake TaxID=1750568 RepID=UPI00190655B6|nr:uncharacterized protein EI90DRAFT_3019370 [Cantharellus anzutake]KAF8324914.1 hypothetical protein EI90DRAFT_3019370 [Cantharellus anzutake]
MLRALPTWKLQRKLRRRSNGVALPFGGSGLSIEIQVGVGRPVVVDDDSVAGFDAPHSQPPESLVTESISFPPIPTPLGHFGLRTMYRLHSNYSLESLESLLSSHFMTPAISPSSGVQPTKVKVDDAPVQFTPTITTAYQRQRQVSLGSGSAASAAGARVALPLPSSSNTSNTSLSSRPFPSRTGPSVDPGTGTSPLSTAPVRTNVPHSPIASSPPSDIALNPCLSSDHHLPGVGMSGTGGVSTASPRLVFGGYGRDVGDLPFAVGLGSGRTSGSMDRTRKESLLGGSNTGDRAQTSSPIPGASTARRPSVTSIHPFKSATVASSPSSHSLSIRLNSPLSPNPSAQSQTQQGGLLAAINDNKKKFPSIGGGSPETHATSGVSLPVMMPAPPKRYSSSFSHRHTSSGMSVASNVVPGAGDGDGGLVMGVGVPSSLGRFSSGTNAPSSLGVESPFKRRTASETLLTMASEDDELSNFVKAIDTRAPLRGGLDFDATLPTMAEESRRSSRSNPPSSVSRHPGLGGVSGPQRGPSTVTSRADVDETLRRMTESFRMGVGSLEGGMRARRRRTESASATFSGSGASSNEREVRFPRHGGTGASTLTEEGSASSVSGSAGIGALGGSHGGRRPSNLSTSSLFTPGHTGRQSYESDQQIVGRMELGNDGNPQAHMQHRSHAETSARPITRPNRPRAY